MSLLRRFKGWSNARLFYKNATAPAARLYQVLVFYKKVLTIYITSTILQEVLRGVHEDSLFSQVKSNLLSLALLKLDPVEAAIKAAQLYRDLRKKGVTIRKPNDCLIAHYGGALLEYMEGKTLPGVAALE